MSYAYEEAYGLVSEQSSEVRAAFIRRTYAHLAGAILAFVGIETALFQAGLAVPVTRYLLQFGQLGWLGVLLLFIAAGWIAQSWAHNATSRGMQYAGLALYVVVEAIIFLPLLTIAVYYVRDPTVLPTAAILTLGIFGGLSTAVMVTKRDFSFLAPILSIGFFVALGLIVCAVLFEFQLGLLFSFAMVALASGAIIYTTSQIMLYYRTDQHVGAALELFAAVALLFWYVLRILIAVSRE
ncbi:MAG: permease [Gemmatales bacterium]|nr:MAG: permease [Gemmatales bacterium]